MTATSIALDVQPALPFHLRVRQPDVLAALFALMWIPLTIYVMRPVLLMLRVSWV